MRKLIVSFLAIASTCQFLLSQSVGIAEEEFTPHSSAALEIKTINKGLLIPRLSEAQRIAISNPARGLLVYQPEGNSGFYYFDGNAWYSLNDSKNDLDTDPSNELQNLHLSGNELILSDGGSVFLPGSSGGNQTLSLEGDSLSISDGNYVLLTSVKDNLGNHQLTSNIETQGYYISADGDNEGMLVNPNGDATFSNNIIVEGTTSTLNLNTTGAVNLTNNSIQTAEIDDNAVTTSKIGNSQITAIKIHPMGASPDQYLRFDGTTWGPADMPGGLNYLGTWNANTNIPYITNSIGNNSDYYVVSSAGDQNLGSGVISFNIGDWVIHNGIAWEKINNSNDVNSVFGRTGSIVAQFGDYTWDLVDKTSSSINDISDINTNLASAGQLMVFNGIQWINTSVSGDIAFNSNGNMQINPGAILYNDIQDAGDGTNTIIVWNGNSWGEETFESMETDGSITNEIQDLSLSGNTLRLSQDLSGVDLSGFLDNTDNQNLTAATLTGTSLQINIENGTSATVDLAPIQDGFTDADDDPANEIISSGVLNGTDLQITEAGTLWTIDLSSLTGTGTDDQNLTAATLTGTSLQIDIENGTSATVDLAPIQDGFTDADDDPANEIISSGVLNGTDLQITEAGTLWTIDLSSLTGTGTDDQNLTAATLTGTSLQIDIENGTSATVDLAPIQDGFTDADDDPANEIISSGVLNGTDLEITEAGTLWTVDLSSLAGTGTDDQNLTAATLTGTSLQIDIENGTSATVDLAPIQDGFTDADDDPANEIISSGVLNGTDLQITEAGTLWTIDLSSLTGTGTDDQNLTAATLTGTSLQIDIENGTSATVDLAPIQDGFTDADADITNELITGLAFDDVSQILTVSEAGTDHTVDLTAASDVRLKENIVSTNFGITDVLKLNVVDYDFISGASNQTGLIAQELYKVYPSAVRVGGKNMKENPWGIRYNMLTPLLTKAMQDLYYEVEELQKENLKLQAENNSFKTEYEHRILELEKKLEILLNSSE